MNYPKLLIINNYTFNDYKGGGITLKNLFLGWPKDKIAIAHFDTSRPIEAVCEKYYKIGINECHFIFPLNKFSTESRGQLNGPYSVKDYTDAFSKSNSTHTQVTTNKTNKYKKLFLNAIFKLGIWEFIHPLRMSNELKSWIKEYNPDIIYCQPENISFINLVLTAHKLTKAKLIVHVMDDWPYLIYKKNILKHILRLLVHYKFLRILRLSSLRIGISKAMAEEFQTRYKLEFKYFHNPIDISVLNTILNPEKIIKDSFLVVYSGRIGYTASHDSIIDVCKCIEELRKDGIKIQFKIYTDLTNTENDFSVFQIEGTSLLPALKDDNFIKKLVEADLLLYPVDFDKQSIDFIRLSFPTKLPSYLISGIPIFCYGPDEVYSIQFMKKNKLGFICNSQNSNVVKNEILNALTNNKVRCYYSKSASDYAIQHFESSKVRKAFHNELIECQKGDII
jgi:glycosyltransferase involved in cell wall biosynthesis